MSFLSKIFGKKDISNKNSRVDSLLIIQFKQIEDLLLNQSDFIGIFGSEDRRALETACESGSSNYACLNLALLYMYGINIDRDIERAERLLKKACASNALPAYRYLALIEDEIKGDIDKAVSYLRKGVEMGDSGAMTNLGIYFMTGRGVELNEGKAIELWKKAANLGEERASINLKMAQSR